MFDDKFKRSCKDIAQITVSHRIDKISKWVEDIIIERMNLSKWFSLQLDEPTNIQGFFQLIVYTR